MIFERFLQGINGPGLRLNLATPLQPLDRAARDPGGIGQLLAGEPGQRSCGGKLPTGPE